MDHGATWEQLELSAVEPGGLDRLMAGDTPAAQAVAAHLAGCPACTVELARLERSSRVIRQVVREMAPADLRERSLALIRAGGVLRGLAGGVAGPPSGAARPARLAPGWVAAIAAAVVVSVVVTSAIVGAQVDNRLVSLTNTIAALEIVTNATLEVTAEPDARRVALTGGQPDLAGTIIYSASTSQLVVVATGLTPPPDGREYRCWVELAGQRERVGRMFFSDDLAYWIGPVPAVQGLTSGATFGVSLVDASGATLGGEPVLAGTL